MTAFLDSPVAVRLSPSRAGEATSTVRLVRSFTRAGVPCREYSQTVVIDNVPVRANGTLCRQPDGTWTLR